MRTKAFVIKGSHFRDLEYDFRLLMVILLIGCGLVWPEKHLFDSVSSAIFVRLGLGYSVLLQIISHEIKVEIVHGV